MALNLIQLAEGDPGLLAAIQRSRKLLNQRALAGAVASAVPVPGLEWLVDAALLSRPEQIDALPARKRDQVQKAIGVVGSLVIGKFITRDLVIRVSAAIGRRLTMKRAARFVPLGGQALSAMIGYAAIRYLGEQHIRDCVEVCRQAHLQLPSAPG